MGNEGDKGQCHPTSHRFRTTDVENEDDQARIWAILRYRFRPTSDVTLGQALRYMVTLRMADDFDVGHIEN